MHTEYFVKLIFILLIALFQRNFPSLRAVAEKPNVEVGDEKVPLHFSFALTVASANIFLLMEKEGKTHSMTSLTVLSHFMEIYFDFFLNSSWSYASDRFLSRRPPT